jgi:hypothetical protein
MLDAIIDTAITAVPLAFAALVITRETLKALSHKRLASAPATPQPLETTNHPIEASEAAPAPENEPEIEQPAEPVQLAPVPSPAATVEATVEAIIQTARAAVLRSYCTQAGIPWRNAHGKGKHLSTSEMRRALLTTGHSHHPWLAA